jgi:hypothetical protein
MVQCITGSSLVVAIGRWSAPAARATISVDDEWTNVVAPLMAMRAGCRPGVTAAEAVVAGGRRRHRSRGVAPGAHPTQRKPTCRTPPQRSKRFSPARCASSSKVIDHAGITSLLRARHDASRVRVGDDQCPLQRRWRNALVHGRFHCRGTGKGATIHRGLSRRDGEDITSGRGPWAPTPSPDPGRG